MVFMAVWPYSVLSSVKTHENTLGFRNKAPKGPQASCLKGTSSAHHLQNIIPKVKGAGCSSCRGAVLQWQRLRESRRKAQHSKILSLNENPVQSIQDLRLGRKFTFQQNNDPKHTARVASRQLSSPFHQQEPSAS